MTTNNLLQPVSNVRIVDHDDLRPNNYNPNKVTESNLQLLQQSILTNGWTLPIVCRPDLTIIDGFHRWTVAGREPLRSMLGGKVPIVIVDHQDHDEDVYGTITHNRARGTHLLEPMRKIVRELLDSGKSIKEISKQLGMRDEEVFRLSGISREQFLDMLAGQEYSEAEIITRA